MLATETPSLPSSCCFLAAQEIFQYCTVMLCMGFGRIVILANELLWKNAGKLDKVSMPRT